MYQANVTDSNVIILKILFFLLLILITSIYLEATMSSSFSRINKGAIVSIDPNTAVPTVIMFQYNPTQLTRNISPQMSDGEGNDRAEPLRLKGAPIETMQLEIEIDATDQLNNGDQQASSLGIYPQLSALEILVYPKSSLVTTNTVLLAAGTIEILPTVAPLTLLVWGVKRVLPVKINDFSITEEMHDINLNPIQAKVNLNLRVLTYNDLSITNPGYYLYLGNQVLKETFASINTANQIGSTISKILS